jgi:hypothetical protein
MSCPICIDEPSLIKITSPVALAAKFPAETLPIFVNENPQFDWGFRKA